MCAHLDGLLPVLRAHRLHSHVLVAQAKVGGRGLQQACRGHLLHSARAQTHTHLNGLATCPA